MNNQAWKAAVLLLFLFVLLQTEGVSAGTAADDRTSVGNMEVSALPEWPVTVEKSGPTLLFSDSPEMVANDGILYQDTVQGDVRLFYHHVNDTKSWKRLAIVVENPGPGAAQLQIQRAGQAGPSQDYLAVGKEVQARYFQGTGARKVSIPAGSAAEILSGDNGVSFRYNELLTGMMDLKTDRPVRIKIVFCPAGAQATEFAAWAPVLPADQYRMRGTFLQADRLLTAKNTYSPVDDNTVAVTLADNTQDAFVKGIDATDGTETVNYGNYGIIYQLRLPTANSGGLAVYLSPQGGEYAGFLGVRYQKPAELVMPTPQGQTAFGTVGDFRQVSLIGRYTSGQDLFVRFSPPGGSNLPVRLVLSPYWRSGGA